MQTPLAVLNGATLRSWARRAVSELAVHRAEINQLNVFPVPDADTGSNMLHTMKAAVEQADQVAGDNPAVSDIAQALASGAVRGARGNSGVVLSQVLRGIAEASKSHDIDAATVGESLNLALQFVERAIADPVEGTVLTVLRAAAQATAGQTTLLDVVGQALQAAREALANTPSQLPALRDAGVVDAGGKGLVLLLEALHHEVSGEIPVPGPAHSVSPSPEPGVAPAPATPELAPATAAQPHPHLPCADTSTPEMEVMFYFRGDLERLTDTLHHLGDSLITAPDSPTSATIHIHTARPAAVIHLAYTSGQVDNLSLDVLPPTSSPSSAASREASTLVIALCPEGGLQDLFEEAGVTVLTTGEETVTRITELARAAHAESLIVLSNGMLSPAEVSEITSNCEFYGSTVTILSDYAAVAGIAAAAVYDPTLSPEEIARIMHDAAATMRVGVLHPPISPAEPTSYQLTWGDGQDPTSVGSIAEAINVAVAKLSHPQAEQLTILYREDLPEPVAELAGKRAGDIEVLAYPVRNLPALVEIGVE